MKFNPEQTQKLKSWAEERDALLQEIGRLQTQKNSLTEENKNAGLEKADIEKQLSEIKGRLAEIKEAEDRYRNSVASDIIALEVRKSQLELECENMKKEVAVAVEKKDQILEMVASVIVMHDKIFDRATLIEEFVGKVKEFGDNEISKFKELFADVEKSCKAIVETNGSNVAQANIVLTKVQKYIFELSKPIVPRRLIGTEKAPVQGEVEITKVTKTK